MPLATLKKHVDFIFIIDLQKLFYNDLNCQPFLTEQFKIFFITFNSVSIVPELLAFGFLLADSKSL